MKKSLIITSTLLMSFSLLFCVNEDVKKSFENVEVAKSTSGPELVRREAMKPDIEWIRNKTNTAIATEYYRINKNILRSTNKVLLNKWLKELK